MIPKTIRAVFFDAVGTLIFPHPPAHEVYAGLARKQGVELDPKSVRERFLAAFRVEEIADRTGGWRTSEERERIRWRTIVTSVLAGLPDPEAGFLELWEHFARPGSWQVNPDASPVLAELGGRGLILGMGTNYDSRVKRVVAGLPELAPLVDRLAISAAVGYRKPAPEFFREMLRLVDCSTGHVSPGSAAVPAAAIRLPPMTPGSVAGEDARAPGSLASSPSEVLFVGDDLENDYDGARAAGLHSVLLDPKGESKVENRIGSLRELLMWLQK